MEELRNSESGQRLSPAGSHCHRWIRVKGGGGGARARGEDQQGCRTGAGGHTRKLPEEKGAGEMHCGSVSLTPCFLPCILDSSILCRVCPTAWHLQAAWSYQGELGHQRAGSWSPGLPDAQASPGVPVDPQMWVPVGCADSHGPCIQACLRGSWDSHSRWGPRSPCRPLAAFSLTAG